MSKAISKTVTIAFENEQAAEHFVDWLCGSGEQHYWEWMTYREEEEPGPITALSFDYWKANGGEFGTNIEARCGRRDER